MIWTSFLTVGRFFMATGGGFLAVLGFLLVFAVPIRHYETKFDKYAFRLGQDRVSELRRFVRVLLLAILVGLCVSTIGVTMIEVSRL